jgi:hypothetical protein
MILRGRARAKLETPGRDDSALRGGFGERSEALTEAETLPGPGDTPALNHTARPHDFVRSPGGVG